MAYVTSSYFLFWMNSPTFKLVLCEAAATILCAVVTRQGAARECNYRNKKRVSYATPYTETTDISKDMYTYITLKKERKKSSVWEYQKNIII